MASTTSPKILLAGATGYIGGTILTHLLKSDLPALKTATITCLIRGAERGETLSKAYGSRVQPVPCDFDDTEKLTKVAAEHDLVINTTQGFGDTFPQAFLRGLAQRKAATGHPGWLVHTSGTSNFSDQPITKTYVETPPDREFDDAKDDLYTYEKGREALQPYPQRTVELGVIDAGLQLGVNTVILNSPTIFGIGTGLFNNTSIQVPSYLQSVVNNGRAVVVEGGKGIWDHVHVEDLAEVYALVAEEALGNSGKNLPRGKKGILFTGNGRSTWLEVAQQAAEACFKEGLITNKEVESVSLAEGAKLLQILAMGENEMGTELALSSNSRTNSTVVRQLGWKPTRGEAAWKQNFQDDLKYVLAKRK